MITTSITALRICILIGRCRSDLSWGEGSGIPHSYGALLTLEGWGNKVTYHERLKESYYILQEYWAGLDAIVGFAKDRRRRSRAARFYCTDTAIVCLSMIAFNLIYSHGDRGGNAAPNGPAQRTV